jgi:hypothetical protein
MSKSCCGGSSCGGGAPKVRLKVASGVEDETSVDVTAEACDCSEQSGCSDAPREKIEAEWVTGYVQTAAGEVPRISTALTFRDTFGSWKCRWSIGRMDYRVPPGLYAVGTPDDASPVLVSANYKMTFDRLRERLGGLDLWLVILDTDGVNVWCAAGKGTFGTEEVVARVRAVGLDKVVSHRPLILPQLGAVGVAAHEVKKQTGFRVVYGPVRAKDLKEFLGAGMVATEKMRTVTFTFRERVILAPVELVGHTPGLIVVFGILFILNAIGFGHYGIAELYGALGAIAVGSVLVPALLPWIPGRAFSFKGGLLGLLWAAGVNLLNGFPAVPAYGWLKALAFMLILPSVSAFCAMNFTGCSTYTSLSGVDREMKIALPTMLLSTAAGVLLLLVSDFIRLFGGPMI